LSDEPGKVNEDPMGAGWFFRFKVNDVAELNGLMDEAAYKTFIDGLG
jgi:glycine cleavage system H protein